MKTTTKCKSVAIIALIGGVSAMCLLSCNPSTKGGGSAMKTGRLTIDMGEGTRWELVISDDALLKSMVLDPLSQAHADPHPADYSVIAVVTVEENDKVIDRVWLFHPFGHFKRDDKCYVTNLSGLKQAICGMRKSTVMQLICSSEDK
jgi:hypothetical protein